MKLNEVTGTYMNLHEVKWSKMKEIEESLTKDVKNMKSWGKSD